MSEPYEQSVEELEKAGAAFLNDSPGLEGSSGSDRTDAEYMAQVEGLDWSSYGQETKSPVYSRYAFATSDGLLSSVPKPACEPVILMTEGEARERLMACLPPRHKPVADSLNPLLQTLCNLKDPRDIVGYVLETIIPTTAMATEGAVLLPELQTAQGDTASGLKRIEEATGMLLEQNRALLSKVEEILRQPKKQASSLPPNIRSAEYISALADVVMTFDGKKTRYGKCQGVDNTPPTAR